VPETAENVAEKYGISRTDQDAFALRSQDRAAQPITGGRFAQENSPLDIPRRKGGTLRVDADEHARATTAEKLVSLPTPFRGGGQRFGC